MVGAIERGQRTPSWEVACRLAAACGYELAIRLYPVEGVGLRDSGQLGLAQVIAEVLHPTCRPCLEAPVATDPRDRRATDMLLDHPKELAATEVELRLVDFQAQLRPAELKREAIARREERPVRLIIAVPNTPSVRRILAAHAELIRRTLPVPSREIWRALRLGQPIGGDGILLIPKPSRRSSARAGTTATLCGHRGTGGPSSPRAATTGGAARSERGVRTPVATTSGQSP